MLSRSVLVIGFLLCLTHVAKTYILLSANIEDVKKLASKFLSDEIVQQVVDLVKKVNDDIKHNLSEENTINQESINNISNESSDKLKENVLRNRLRPRKEKLKGTTIKDRHIKYDMNDALNWDHDKHYYDEVDVTPKSNLRTEREKIKETTTRYRQIKDGDNKKKSVVLANRLRPRKEKNKETTKKQREKIYDMSDGLNWDHAKHYYDKVDETKRERIKETTTSRHIKDGDYKKESVVLATSGDVQLSKTKYVSQSLEEWLGTKLKN